MNLTQKSSFKKEWNSIEIANFDFDFLISLNPDSNIHWFFDIFQAPFVDRLSFHKAVPIQTWIFLKVLARKLSCCSFKNFLFALSGAMRFFLTVLILFDQVCFKVLRSKINKNLIAILQGNKTLR